jgi:hypothetical protein
MMMLLLLASPDKATEERSRSIDAGTHQHKQLYIDLVKKDGKCVLKEKPADLVEGDALDRGNAYVTWFVHNIDCPEPARVRTDRFLHYDSKTAKDPFTGDKKCGPVARGSRCDFTRKVKTNPNDSPKGTYTYKIFVNEIDVDPKIAILP